jgi:hypothetical protein
MVRITNEFSSFRRVSPALTGFARPLRTVEEPREFAVFYLDRREKTL